MAKQFTSWVPGYAAIAQGMGPGTLDWAGEHFTDVTGVRTGYGATFRLEGGKQDWFHIPIPTPVIIEDQHATLVKVMVLFALPDGAAITDVNIWDGPNRIEIQHPNVTGDRAAGVGSENTFDLNPPVAVHFGVGISLLVENETDSDADVYFAGAGGEFSY